MSGSSFSTWSLVEDPVHYAVKVANSLNCSVPSNMMKNHQDIVKCLREKPLADLMSVEVTAPSFLTAMGPSRDGVLIPSDFGTSSIHIRWEGDIIIGIPLGTSLTFTKLFKLGDYNLTMIVSVSVQYQCPSVAPSLPLLTKPLSPSHDCMHQHQAPAALLPTQQIVYFKF